jgi:hypothetical protein
MKFTVAITVWRRQRLLPHAIQSVLAQSHRDWEIRVYSDTLGAPDREAVFTGVLFGA